MLAFVLLAAFVWGVAIAAFMQFTRLGHFLSLRLTWFMTALGCGGDLLLALLLIDSAGRIAWWEFVAVFFASSFGPSLRGIVLHQTHWREVMDGAKDTDSE